MSPDKLDKTMKNSKSITVRNTRTGQVITASKKWVENENTKNLLEGGGLQDLNKTGLWEYLNPSDNPLNQ
jgi:hypothetical protein